MQLPFLHHTKCNNTDICQIHVSDWSLYSKLFYLYFPLHMINYVWYGVVIGKKTYSMYTLSD